MIKLALRAPQYGPVRLTNSQTLDFTSTPSNGLCFDTSDIDSSPYSASRAVHYLHGVRWNGGKARYTLNVRVHSNSAAATTAGWVMMNVMVSEDQVEVRTLVERTHVPVGVMLYHTFRIDFIHKPHNSSGVYITILLDTDAVFGEPKRCEVHKGAASLTIQPIE